MYYKDGETKNFENIECAWPIFVCFLIIDAKFKNNEAQLKEYKELLFDKLVKREHTYGDYILPKYYYVSFAHTFYCFDWLIDQSIGRT